MTCLTCNENGMISGFVNAEPCPECNTMEPTDETMVIMQKLFAMEASGDTDVSRDDPETHHQYIIAWDYFRAGYLAGLKVKL